MTESVNDGSRGNDGRMKRLGEMTLTLAQRAMISYMIG